jgi:hypothetical protein
VYFIQQRITRELGGEATIQRNLTRSISQPNSTPHTTRTTKRLHSVESLKYNSLQRLSPDIYDNGKGTWGYKISIMEDDMERGMLSTLVNKAIFRKIIILLIIQVTFKYCYCIPRTNVHGGYYGLVVIPHPPSRP